MEILKEYERIIQQEARLKAKNVPNRSIRYLPKDGTQYIYGITKRIMAITENSTILRSGNTTSGITQDLNAFESDGAHTNLVRSLVKYALDSRYGWGTDPSNSGRITNYDRFEIDEAITIHDLPENITGDIPDNRDRDEVAKIRIENEYFDELTATYPPSQISHYRKIRKLLREMQKKSSPEGRILYVADKLSAILMMLFYDKIGYCPGIHPYDPKIAKISPEEKKLCKVQKNGKLLYSELWTLDFLYGRNIEQYDDSSFFLAILVMATLITHEKWYSWREKQYVS